MKQYSLNEARVFTFDKSCPECRGKMDFIGGTWILEYKCKMGHVVEFVAPDMGQSLPMLRLVRIEPP